MGDKKEDKSMAMDQKKVQPPVNEAERKKIIKEAHKEGMKKNAEVLRMLSKN